MKLESTQVGVAGEYFVAAELSIRGYLASITLRNSRGIDIIASTPGGESSVSIQVKSNNNGKTVWLMSKKSEKFYSNNHFYIFVSLKDLTKAPEYYIVPSEDVARFTTECHKAWISGKKRDGGKRKDGDLRKFITEPDGKYRDSWHSLFKNSEQ